MEKILVLATAGLKPDQLSDKKHVYHPRVDFIELQQLLDIRVLDYGLYNNTRLGRIFRYLETQLRSDLYLTLLGWIAQSRHRLIFTMSERAGIPFAGIRRLFPSKKPFVTMFQSWSMRQERTITRLKLFSSMDTIAVHCQSMKDHLASLGAPEDCIHILPYSVDQEFFSAPDGAELPQGMIMSIGEVRSRDYHTLIKAVENLPTKLVIAASGPWYAREKNHDLDGTLPGNVEIVQYLPFYELRKLYTQANFIVLPVYDQVFSAGATSVMEAGAMGRPVIVTKSRGIVDFVEDGETGILVEPGSVEAMQEAIQYLLTHPEEARRMGNNARERVETRFSIENYIESMAHLLQSSL